MDYNKIYEEEYNKNYIFEQNSIKDELLRYKEKNKTFSFAHNNILERIQVKINSNEITKNSALNYTFHVFKISRSNYPEDFIKLALKNDTLDHFKSISSQDLPTNYSFINFTTDLAKLMSSNEISRLFNNHSVLFSMMYKLDDFRKFEIVSYNNLALEDTPLFKKLHKTLYPDTYVKIVKATGEIQTSKYQEVEFEISKFSLEEKLLLLHVCHIKTSKIPVTEFCKIMLITNNINDFRMFIEEPSKNYYYTRVSKGIEAYSSIEKKRELINSTIDKINYFKLPAINSRLNLIKKEI